MVESAGAGSGGATDVTADPHVCSRRAFFAGLLKTCALAGVTVGGGLYFSRRPGAGRRRNGFRVPSFVVPGTEDAFAVARGSRAGAVTRAAVAAAGGIQRFVRPGDKVLIKVNAAFARPPWMGATTSPEVCAEVVRLCLAAGADVRVTDNPISDTERCFELSGIREAVTRAGGEVFLPRPEDFARLRVNDGVIGTWSVFFAPLQWCTRLIGIPAVKTHNLSGATLAMKNWYGFMGGSRSRFHQDIHTVIAELGAFLRPSLVVLDGTRLLIDNGPTGGSVSDVAPGNTVAVSTDQVAIDALGADLLGIRPEDVGFIRLAEARGLGSADYRSFSAYREVSL